MTACQQELRKQGKPYPRTCAMCGLGPCKRPTQTLFTVEDAPPPVSDECLCVKCTDRHAGGFQDGNGEYVTAGDRVEYQFGARRGTLIEALQDGDASVEFDDTGKYERVKWVYLCKVPAWVESPPLQPALPRAHLLIAFTGLAGSGKTTAARYLVEQHGFTRMRFAGPLKDMCRALGLTDAEIDGDLKEKPCALLGGKTPRYAMQTLGTEWGRDLINSHLWIRAFQGALAKTRGNVVVDDCRFPNEADAIRDAGGYLVKIERPGAGAGAAGHSSEGQDLGMVLNTIVNSGPMMDLHRDVDALIRNLSWAAAALVK